MTSSYFNIYFNTCMWELLFCFIVSFDHESCGNTYSFDWVYPFNYVIQIVVSFRVFQDRDVGIGKFVKKYL